MTLRRLTLAAALAIVPVLRAADANLEDWLHDNLNNRALWLYGSNNLGFETAPAELPPRTPGKRWVLNRDGNTAAVVYFVPGDIRSVEVDTHRTPDATGDFTLSVSSDGKFWRPLSAVAAPLEDAAGWQYRLLSTDVVPAHQMHLRVEFPAGATAKTHRLTEVWVRFKWDETLVDPAAPQIAPAGAESEATTTPIITESSALALAANPASSGELARPSLAAAGTASGAREALAVFDALAPRARVSVSNSSEAAPRMPATSGAPALDQADRTRGPALLTESRTLALARVAAPTPAATPSSAPVIGQSTERAASILATTPAATAVSVSPETSAPATARTTTSAERLAGDATFAARSSAVAALAPAADSNGATELRSTAPTAAAVDAKPVQPLKKKFVQRGRIGPRSK